MHSCNVPKNDQERILQGYMMHSVVSGGRNDDNEYYGSSEGVRIPNAVSRMPDHLQHQLTIYARAEAIKRRDPAFFHCSNDFLFAMVGALDDKQMLLTGDYYFKELENVPQSVVLIEKGSLQVIRDGKCVRILQAGDVIGKRWLLAAAKKGNNETTTTFHAQTSLRAQTECTLITGLSDLVEVRALTSRFPKDTAILKADRTRVNTIRESHVVNKSHLLRENFGSLGIFGEKLEESDGGQDGENAAALDDSELNLPKPSKSSNSRWRLKKPRKTNIKDKDLK